MCQLEKNGKLGCFCIFNCDYCWRWFGDAVPVGVAYFICTRDIFYLYIKEGKRNKEKCKKLIIYWYRIYHYRRVTYNHV